MGKKLFCVLFFLILGAAGCEFSPKTPSLDQYPSFFIKEGVFTARAAVEPSASGIVAGVDFATAVELLKYQKGLRAKTPLMLTLNETTFLISDERLIGDTDLVLIGDPCHEESPILSEAYISCQEWQEKPYAYEIALQQKEDALRLYFLYKESPDDKGAWYRFLRDYISMRKPLPSNGMKICFSEKGEIADC